MIPFLDLKAQYQDLREEIEPAVLAVLASGNYVQGEEVARLESEFADYCGAAHAVATNSGTSALHLALLAAGIQPGDEVITVPFTFVATTSAICYTGAVPVFVDIDPETFNMDPALIEAAITPRTKAILPVHLYGQMADMDAILDVAARHGLTVIEDACQAHGAEYYGQRTGSFGASACFSFYPGKNLGGCGEGGIVVTDDDEQMRTMRMLRDWGQSKRYHHILKGFNYRLDNIQAAVLRIKLRHLDSWTEARRDRVDTYRSLLQGSRRVTVPTEAHGRRHVYHVFAVRAQDRDALQRGLLAAGIQTGLHYPVPVHLQPAHADLGYRQGDFPQAEAAAQQVLSLPIYPELTTSQIMEIVQAVEHSAYVA
ncbi:DegT/DnrJ/EryC1/StrS aminotransferase family protein [Aliihoeflea sp. 40Bstr573]|uniref:DegT/DnrJ/EryC1/StrS family aminotransferase n=1 Tax=Aliihoeflea sp. 40Bstr573 TaxID=2696467 RepID=UPI0020964B1F|nr:DegT/DnrJ/EryC1/StrS family aminotransferase [Aliihoeflea sp. 40Bstr573]MCO6388795.1 aminotransferase class I/II-fold pyridoxal phosphate-dependent enzyme [Aliihoeflea sp. 40Bstr573]